MLVHMTAVARNTSYPGGKARDGVYQKLINLIPPHDTYIEAFLGGGAIMRFKKPARSNIGIDIDAAALARFGDALRSGRILLGNNGYVGPGPELICSDAVTWLLNIRQQLTVRSFVYLDPPYLRETRKQQRDMYPFEFDTPAQHKRLLDCAKSLSCMVMISGYYSDLYARELAGWNTISFQTTTRGSTLATEHVWMNYPEPTALHDYRYLGEDYRERERINKKKTRWLNRLKSLDSLERQALLSVIEEFFYHEVRDVKPCDCGCGRIPVWQGNGRPPRFYSNACRQRHFRRQKRNETVTKLKGMKTK